MTGQAVVRVLVDENICIGIGLCVEREPDAFELGDDAISRPVDGVWLSLERAERVCRECPSGAISVAAGGLTP